MRRKLDHFRFSMLEGLHFAALLVISDSLESKAGQSRPGQTLSDLGNEVHSEQMVCFCQVSAGMLQIFGKTFTSFSGERVVERADISFSRHTWRVQGPSPLSP